MPHQKLRAAIIGLGVGEAHIEGLNAHPSCEVTTLCDSSPEVETRVRSRYPTLRFESQADKVLEDPSIDLVSICSYDSHHGAQILKALKAGKHVFVEKPTCTELSEARKIQDALKTSKGKFSSNLILRKSPRFSWLKQEIDANRLGTVYQYTTAYNYGRIQKIWEGWRGKEPNYSVVLGGAVHMIDLLLWFSKAKVERVQATGTNLASRPKGFAFKDTVAALLEFSDGSIAQVSANFPCVFPHFHPLEVYGTQATFINGFDHGLLYTARDSKAPGPKSSQQEPQRVNYAYPGVKKGDLLYGFVNAILGQQAFEISQEEIFETLSVCFAIEAALAQKAPVWVKDMGLNT